jgi:hypothetical protein
VVPVAQLNEITDPNSYDGCCGVRRSSRPVAAQSLVCLDTAFSRNIDRHSYGRLLSSAFRTGQHCSGSRCWSCPISVPSEAVNVCLDSAHGGPCVQAGDIHRALRIDSCSPFFDSVFIFLRDRTIHAHFPRFSELTKCEREDRSRCFCGFYTHRVSCWKGELQ